MISTTTETNSITRIVLRPNMTRVEATPLLERLVEIYERFERDWVDPKSVQIKDWIVEVLDISRSINDISDEVFNQRASQYLDVLVGRVLVDDIFNTIRLVNPVLVREKNWTCERMFFEEANSTFTLVPHSLANEIRLWAANFMAPVGTELSTEADALFNIEILRGTPLGRMAINAYKTMLRSAIFNQGIEEQTRSVREATERLSSLRESIVQETQEQIAAAEQRAAERQTQLTDRIVELERHHQENIANLQRQLEEVRNNLAAVQAGLAEARGRNDAHELLIMQLNQSIREERQRLVEALRRAAEQPNSGCQIL